MATIKCHTLEENQTCLKELRIGLLTLDKYVPIGKHHKFNIYTPQSKSAENYGKEGAINQDLEIAFYPQGQAGPICLKETGPSLWAVAEVLDEWNLGI